MLKVTKVAHEQDNLIVLQRAFKLFYFTKQPPRCRVCGKRSAILFLPEVSARRLGSPCAIHHKCPQRLRHRTARFPISQLCAGLHLSALIATSAVLAFIPIGAIGAMFLLLWLLVLLLPPSLPGDNSGTESHPDWRPPAPSFRVHRTATTALAAAALAHTTAQYLLWVGGNAWLRADTCDALSATLGIICGAAPGYSNGGGDGSAVFQSMAASGVTLACLAVYRCCLRFKAPV